MSFEIHHIFPVPLLSYKNFLSEEYFQQVFECATKEEYKDRVFPNKSDRVQAGSTKNFLKQLPWLKDEITETFKEYAYNVLMADMSVDFKIGSSWVVLTKPGCSSEQHIHPNYYYTGCLYLTDDPSPINFFRGTTVYNHQERFQFKFHSINEYNTNSIAYKPEKNEILFFPSYLSHKVTTNLSDKNRYSLGFNIHPVGIYGDQDSTIHVQIIDDLD